MPRSAPIVFAVSLLWSVAGHAEEKRLATSSGAASTSWAPQKVSADVPLPPGATRDDFGTMVAISDETALVGAPREQVKGVGQGVAYVYVKAAAGAWGLVTKLSADDGQAGDQFGSYIRFSGSTAFIAAPGADAGVGHPKGAVYIFARVDGVWTQDQKLVANGNESMGFGGEMAFNATDAFIAGSESGPGGIITGMEFVFRRSPRTHLWNQTQVLRYPGLDENALFGYDVELSDSIALIGAPLATVGSNGGQGVVYEYSTNSQGVWILSDTLTRASGTAGENLGTSIALIGENIAMIGAPGAANGVFASGAVYEFDRGSFGWTESSHAVTVPPDTFALFGLSVSAYVSPSSSADSGAMLLVGAPGEGVWESEESGAVYLFERHLGTWIQTQRFDKGIFEQRLFGHVVALTNSAALIGTQVTDGGSGKGEAYFFTEAP